MKRFVSILAMLAMLLTLAACGGGGSGGSAEQSSGSDVDKLVSDYGFQWEDTSAPILNEKGAQELSYTVYSSKNASALDYNDMKVMQDLYASTNVKVNWENVSESIYAQQKNLIFGNTDDRPDAIYHAGMSAGEIIKYAQRHVLLPINEYLQYSLELFVNDGEQAATFILYTPESASSISFQAEGGAVLVDVEKYELDFGKEG